MHVFTFQNGTNRTTYLWASYVDRLGCGNVETFGPPCLVLAGDKHTAMDENQYQGGLQIKAVNPTTWKTEL